MLTTFFLKATAAITGISSLVVVDYLIDSPSPIYVWRQKKRSSLDCYRKQKHMCSKLVIPKCLLLYLSLSQAFCSQGKDAPKIRDAAILDCELTYKGPTLQCMKLAAHISG